MASNSQNEIYTIEKGFCVIVNIKYFGLHERGGSEESVKRIKEAFKFLNCNVKVYKESEYRFTDEEVRNVIIESIKSKEFNECDGFVLYIHTHGCANTFLTSNRKLILRNEIIDMFKTENIVDLNKENNEEWRKGRNSYKKNAKNNHNYFHIYSCLKMPKDLSRGTESIDI